MCQLTSTLCLSHVFVGTQMGFISCFQNERRRRRRRFCRLIWCWMCYARSCAVMMEVNKSIATKNSIKWDARHGIYECNCRPNAISVEYYCVADWLRWKSWITKSSQSEFDASAEYFACQSMVRRWCDRQGFNKAAHASTCQLIEPHFPRTKLICFNSISHSAASNSLRQRQHCCRHTLDSRIYRNDTIPSPHSAFSIIICGVVSVGVRVHVRAHACVRQCVSIKFGLFANLFLIFIGIKLIKNSTADYSRVELYAGQFTTSFLFYLCSLSLHIKII